MEADSKAVPAAQADLAGAGIHKAGTLGAGVGSILVVGGTQGIQPAAWGIQVADKA